MQALLHFFLVHVKAVADQLTHVLRLLIAYSVVFLEVKGLFVGLGQQAVADLHEQDLGMIDVQHADSDLGVPIFENMSLLPISLRALT